MRAGENRDGSVAACLPSGEVVAFDPQGRVIDRLCGRFEDVAQLVVDALKNQGSFFWIDASMEAYGEPFDPRESHWMAESKTTFQIRLGARECSAAGWLQGGSGGREVARATWLWTATGKKFELPRGWVWELVTDTAHRRSA